MPRNPLPSAPAARRRGFTLVELLVVISIIAVLASLILPGVVNSRRAARRAQCLNNLKQLGIAFVDYYTTHNAFPASGRIDLNSLGGDNEVESELTKQLSFSANHFTARKRDYAKVELSPPEPHPGGMRYSWVRELLPRLDRSDLYEAWDDTDEQGYGTYLDTGVSGSGKLPPMSQGDLPGITQTEIRTLFCPEDSSVHPGKGNLSYVVNGGFTPHVGYWPSCASIGGIPEANWVIDNNFKMGLMFLEGYYYVDDHRRKYGRRHTPVTVRDGLTTTIMVTENVNAGYNENVTWGDSSEPIVEEVNWGCPYPFNTSFFVQTPMTTPFPGTGLVIIWAKPELPHKYKDANPRNESGGINGDLTLLNESKHPYPSSFHTGGVHIMMCDGTVRFLAESISGDLWARLVTPDGSHVAGPGEDAKPILRYETYGGNAQIPINERDIP